MPNDLPAPARTQNRLCSNTIARWTASRKNASPQMTDSHTARAGTGRPATLLTGCYRCILNWVAWASVGPVLRAGACPWRSRAAPRASEYALPMPPFCGCTPDAPGLRQNQSQPEISVRGNRNRNRNRGQARGSATAAESPGYRSRLLAHRRRFCNAVTQRGVLLSRCRGIMPPPWPNIIGRRWTQG